MESLQTVNLILSILFFTCYSYQFVYLAVPFLKEDRPAPRGKYHRYAVLIAARNEEAVIAQLIESIRAQDYPGSLVQIFVAADNCTDATAQAARSAGAAVYQRENREQIGKGYVLRFLLEQIQRDYGLEQFDGFFVFDADNLLRPDYIRQMDRTFSQGYEIVTSYRNSKNYGDNWISAGYALWFLRESEYLNHARMLLGTSAAVSGTGFLFSRQVLEDCGGWNFFLLTEDIEFTIHNITAGRRVGYCPQAELFDEQPVTFRQSWRQRLRWAKGYLQVFYRYGGKLVRGMFRKEGGFACFDMCMANMPAILLALACCAANILLMVTGVWDGETVLSSLLGWFVNTYGLLYFLGAVTTATQWRRIHAQTWQKVLYTFTFPFFMLTYIPISLCALFQKVEWLPVEHTVGLSIHELDQAEHKTPALGSGAWKTVRRLMSSDHK